MKQNEPSAFDTIAGIATAILAATLMLAAVLVPLLLLMAIVEQGVGSIFAGVLVASGILAAGFWWANRRHRRYVQRRH